jgi:tellurite resistance-related uncharacterized protein
MKKVMLGALAFALIFQTAVLAAVTVEKGERAGTWMITSPAGKQINVGPKDSLPAIEDGSMVLVPGGEAKFTTTGKSTVYVVEAIPFKLLENTTAKRGYSGSDVSIEVLAGKVTVTKPDNQTLELDAGDQVALTKDNGLKVVKGEVVLSESSGKTAKFGAGKTLEKFCKVTPVKNSPPTPPKI